MSCSRSFIRNKTPSVGSTIYNTNSIDNADKKKIFQQQVKTNIFIKQSKRGRVNTKNSNVRMSVMYIMCVGVYSTNMLG